MSEVAPVVKVEGAPVAEVASSGGANTTANVAEQTVTVTKKKAAVVPTVDDKPTDSKVFIVYE